MREVVVASWTWVGETDGIQMFEVGGSWYSHL